MTDVDTRLDLITRGTAEVLNRDLLASLLASGMPLKHYIGFEISGRVHLGTGLMAMAKVRDLQRAGVECQVFLADWHTWINDKLGGDLEAIRQVATGYFAEGLRAGLRATGGDADEVGFVLGTDLYHGNDDYWATVLEVSKATSLSRMQRSVTILGRQEGSTLDFAKLVYPAMQAADVFALGAHIVHAGLDQRKAHVIAIDAATALTRLPLRGPSGEKLKPVAVHHPLIMSLAPPARADGGDPAAAAKMSKSSPNSAIFIDDTEADVRRKIRRAFCPPAEVEGNPVLNWVRHLVFDAMQGELVVPSAAAGRTRFTAYDELAAAYAEGRVHPGDLKPALTGWLLDVLADARAHFTTGPGRELRDHLLRLQGA